MDQAGHVIPSAEVQSKNVVAEVVQKLLHLERQWMRLNQRHALDVIARPSPRLGDSLKDIAPPQRLFRRFRFGNVEG